MKNNIIPTYRLGVQIRVICAIVGLLFAIGTPVFAADERKILIMGDSLMAWNRSTGRSVAKFLERELGSRVQDRSRVGASIISKTPLFSSAGLSIPLQFRAGRRDWIILNGGGNDLLFGCGCNACDDRMDQLAAADGSWGAIPNLLDRLSATGARVIYIGYLRSPGVGSMIEHCRDDGDELERRLIRITRQMPGVDFISLRDLVPAGDRSYHALDMIHPSAKGSASIARRIAAIMRR